MVDDMNTSESFYDLLNRVRQGDENALQLLLDRYDAEVRREIRFSLLDSRLKRVVSESDIYQSVVSRFCIDLWAGRYEFDRPEAFGALLKKIVRARVSDSARHWNAQKRDLRRNADLGSGLNQVAGGVQESTPSQIVANRELLEKFVQQLTAAERQIMKHRQHGKSWQEIAEEMNTSDGTEKTPDGFRKQYERALSRVAEELGLEN